MTPKLRNYTQRLQRGKREHKRARIWSAMRILRSFTLADLQATCELKNKDSAGTFVAALRRAGFVAARRGNCGRHEPVQFRLVRDSGPHCPSIVHGGKTVWDPNTDTDYPIEGGAP